MSVELYSINTSLFRLDGGSMFGVVPRVVWQRSDHPDEQNRILLGLRVLLLRTGDRRVMVDAGVGNWQSERFISRYDVATPDVDFNRLLAPYDESRGSITDVIITHLHFDHAGGLVSRSADGELAPTFPNARHWVQRRQWKHALTPTPKDRASFQRKYLDMLSVANLELLDGSALVAPGVSVETLDGHTPGMQAVLVETDEGTCFYAADLIPTASHVPAPFVMAYDNQPTVTIREKLDYLERAAWQKWKVYFEHDPRHEYARIKRVKEGRFEAEFDTV